MSCMTKTEEREQIKKIVFISFHNTSNHVFVAPVKTTSLAVKQINLFSSILINLN